jgi:hypothetical protein
MTSKLLVYRDFFTFPPSPRFTTQVSHPEMKRLHSLSTKLVASEFSGVPISYQHVRRAFNKQADRLANEAVDLRVLDDYQIIRDT